MIYRKAWHEYKKGLWYFVLYVLQYLGATEVKSDLISTDGRQINAHQAHINSSKGTVKIFTILHF